MASRMESLKQALQAFHGSRSLVGSPKLLLEALRMEALDEVDDPDPPNALPLEKIVQQAARLVTLRGSKLPLNQVRNQRLLWEFFGQLRAAGAGRTWNGRRGSPTRFTFHPSIAAGELRRVFDEVGIRPRSLDGADIPRPQDAVAAPSAPVQGKSLDRDAVVALLKQHSEELHQLGLAALSLFGSVARNDARPDSDVDLLATFERPVTSDGFFAAKFFLEDLLGRRVDLLTESALRDRVRRTIANELIRVA